MRDSVLWRKESRIIMALAAALAIDEERALDVYYSTQTARQLSDPKYGLQLMSDGYIVEDILTELREQAASRHSRVKRVEHVGEGREERCRTKAV